MDHDLHDAMHAAIEIKKLERKEARIRTRKRSLFVKLSECIDRLGAKRGETGNVNHS